MSWLYGCETWSVFQYHAKTSASIYKSIFEKNPETIFTRSGRLQRLVLCWQPVQIQSTNRKWHGIGVHPMKGSKCSWEAGNELKFSGQRKIGRPWTTWKRTLEVEIKEKLEIGDSLGCKPCFLAVFHRNPIVRVEVTENKLRMRKE